MTASTPSTRPGRRRLLAALAGIGLAPMMRLSLASTGGQHPERFVFVILRGGMDGLMAVPAPGDPAFAQAGPLLWNQQFLQSVAGRCLERGSRRRF